jgi:hypothetical protein
MGRLKLIGEPEGGGTDDHSALSNLDYAQSGHSGFVPSQGEALIDILRLNQNVVRDSGGNDRIQLGITSPHIKLTDEVRIGTRLGVGADPQTDVGLRVAPTMERSGNITVLGCNPTVRMTGGAGNIYAMQGQATALVYSAATAVLMAGLYFTALGGSAGTIQQLYGVWVRTGLQMYTGSAPTLWGAKLRSPMLFFSTYPSTVYGMEIDDQGYYAAGTHNAIGLKINDQTAVTGNKYLVEAGPSTPYLRLVGGGDPPENKSNLYLKFGSTLYRIVKSGSYMTLEAT